MPVSIETGQRPDPVVVKVSGPTSKTNLSDAFVALQSHAEDGRTLLLDFRSSLLAVSPAEFMTVIDLWFELLGANTRAALVFCGEGQKDQAMLFDTKSFLVGGNAKTFSQCDAARNWLGAGLTASR